MSKYDAASTSVDLVEVRVIPVVLVVCTSIAGDPEPKVTSFYYTVIS